MAQFSVLDLDSEILAEFIDEFSDRREVAEQLILDLEQDTTNMEMLNALFREIHTIKGNMGLIGIDPPVLMLQKLEDLLHMIRTGELAFEHLVGDLTLLLVDRCSSFLDECTIKSVVEYDETLYLQVAEQIEKVHTASDDEKVNVLYGVLATLDPNTRRPETEVVEITSDDQMLSQLTGQDEDLLFMLNIAEQAQYRTTFWQGKLERVLRLVLGLNRISGKPVSPSQLVAAVCAHDIAMGFLPLELLTKDTRLTEVEKPRMRSHVRLSAELLSYYPKYEEARLIVTQHHEHMDGEGYPGGISGKKITAGAQILSVVYTFEAITYGYSRDSNRHRPTMRAIMELNRYAGTQFEPVWVERMMELTRLNQNK